MVFLRKSSRKARGSAFFGVLLPFVGANFISSVLAQAPAAPPVAPAPAAPASPAENVPLAVLPFLLHGDTALLSVPMTQAGRGEKYRVSGKTRPFLLVLDSGADTLMLTAESFTARHIALPPVDKKDQTSVEGIGNSNGVSARFIPGVEMLLGEIPLRGTPLVASVKPLSQLGLDGMLGAEIFRACVVEIDYSAKTVRLFAPNAFTPPAPGTGFVSLPIRFVGEAMRPVIAVDVTPYGFGKTTANLQIDTGAGGTIAFNAPFVKRNGWQAFAPKTVPSIGIGINGTTNERRGRLKQISLGGVFLAAPYADFSFNTKGMMASEESDGIIGGAILRRFTVVLDYNHSVLYLRPNAASIALPFAYSYYGFMPKLERTPRGWEIESVDAGSPAARAGIKKGDVLVAVDKQPVGALSFDGLYDALQKGENGKPIFTISDSNGEKKRDVRISPIAL